MLLTGCGHARTKVADSASDGASIAPVDIMDAEGEIRIPVKDDKRIRYDLVGSHMENYDFITLFVCGFPTIKPNLILC